jgi:hypothetical protein
MSALRLTCVNFMLLWSEYKYSEQKGRKDLGNKRKERRPKTYGKEKRTTDGRKESHYM